MLTTVSKQFNFEAAHSLPYLPAGHKCARLHGHSYRFDVEVDGSPDERGFVLDYAEISLAVDPIVARLDHENLNEIFDFHTTAENLAAWLYEEIKLPVARIIFYETSKTRVIYPARQIFRSSI